MNLENSLHESDAGSLGVALARALQVIRDVHLVLTCAEAVGSAIDQRTTIKAALAVLENADDLERQATGKSLGG